MMRSSLASAILLATAAVLSLISVSHAVEWSKLKKCHDLGFCRRHRHFAAASPANYILDLASLSVSSWGDHPALIAQLRADARPDLLFVVLAFAHGIFRIIVDDANPTPHARHVVQDVLMEHVVPLSLSSSYLTVKESTAMLTLPSASFSLRINSDPFSAELVSADGQETRIVVNAGSRLLVHNFATGEHICQQATESTAANSDASVPEEGGAPSQETPTEQSDNGAAQPAEEGSEQTTGAPVGSEVQAGDDSTSSDSAADGPADSSESPDGKCVAISPCDGCTAEEFRGNTDPKRRGPESVGVDIAFPFANHVYGIPERTVSFSIHDTIDSEGQTVSEPHRMYNLDVFEFELDQPLGLYGSIPLLHARKGPVSAAVFWMNTAETYIDITTPKTGGRSSHWYSESGLLDILLLPGPTPVDVQEQYTWLTGPPAMPQYFSLAYHQCRWNYRDEEDSKTVDAGFDKHDIPYDVLWLDIEHTNGKRYFTWDLDKFPQPLELQNHLAARGRKMVTIVDPHIKRDKKYFLHKIATDENLYVRTPDGQPYKGWCWPGDSGYLDVFSGKVRARFSSLFNPKDYFGFSDNLYIWNDMNEPSVFNGPEGTMAKDLLHEGDVEHRHIHNIFGHYFMQSTYEGLITGHGGNDRPFVLSRSFFAGSQKYGTIWTGDNSATWEHLQSSVRMLLPLQISGMVFSGADVGGFFGNPTAELLARWYQVGAFQPFFRAHAHLDTNRREPWLFGEPYTSVIANAIRTRYQFLPLWYTLFAANSMGSKTGFMPSSLGPPMRPLWWEFPEDSELDSNQSQWIVGNSLLVAPVMTEGATTHNFYLPHGANWYDLFAGENSGKMFNTLGLISVPVTLERMIVLQRGGTIVPKKDRWRRSSAVMRDDPYTLVVALDADRKASGELYIDDGSSYNFRNGAYVLRRFSYADDKFTVETVGGGKIDIPEASIPIERVVILGFGDAAPNAVVEGSRDIDFVFSAENRVLTLQRLGVAAGKGSWTVAVKK